LLKNVKKLSIQYLKTKVEDAIQFCVEKWEATLPEKRFHDKNIF